MARSTKSLEIKFRLDEKLNEKIKEAAGDRSVSEMIRGYIEAGLAPRVADPWFADVVAAISHAAAGASGIKEHPPLAPGMMDRDGKQQPYDVERWGPDITAYECFAGAVNTLLRALAPAGIAAVSQDAELRLTDRLIALALGALGERGIEAFANLSEVEQQGIKQ